MCCPPPRDAGSRSESTWPFSTVLLSIIWYGGRLSIRTWDQETTVLYWPVGLLYAAMPVGTLLTLVFIIHQTVCLVRSSESDESHTE